MLRYLEQEEKGRCRKLWKEAFPEDGEAFLDYYMRVKGAANRILVWEEKGEILSMLHRNPCRITAGEKKWECDYIVGVATAAKARRRGYMRRLMTKALIDMEEEGVPFGFLMPADESLYTPFGFSRICGRPRWELNERGKMLEACRLEEKMTEEQAAAWMERWLSARYNVYTRRDGVYVKALKTELASESGYLEVLLEKGRAVGIRGLWGESHREQRLLYAEEEFVRKEDTAHPPFMARITNLDKFMEAVHLKQEIGTEKLELCVGIKDDILEKNNGNFLWKLDRRASRLRGCPGGGAQGTPDISTGIGELAGWLMGGFGTAAAKKDGFIRTLGKVFFDEVV